MAIDGGKTGYLIMARALGRACWPNSNGFKGLRRIRSAEAAQKAAQGFLLILGVLGMITIFGSVWFGFRLSKSSRPHFALQGPRALRKAISISSRG
ncbi:MAG: hypothetical protein ACLSAH_09250 [Bilophila wadsworthia]